jgi:subtilisin family serine protease
VNAAVLAAVVLATAVPHAQGTAAACAEPVGVYAGITPWPQRLLDPGRVWPLTTGKGVTVAVLGTGVDATNPQFGAGRVTGGGAGTDCDGRGTFAAGIVAARATGATTFAGMAPDVRVLPVRYTQTTDQGNADVDPGRLADAIDTAVAAGAGVVYVVVPSTVDSPALRSAVARAYAADAVVVAPATGYPAADPAVLAVAAVAPDGTAASDLAGDHVDLAAPGTGLVSLGAGSEGRPGHVWPVDDPVFAAAFVAGTVALVRAYRPDLTAADVVARVERTASRTAAGGRDPKLGWGVVNPYAAVTAEGVDGVPASGAGPTAVAPARPAPAPARDIAAVWVAAAFLMVAGGLAFAALALRRWRRSGP